MQRIGMGLIGAGLVGPQHVEAVRRLGFVDVVAVAGSSEVSAQAKADAMGIPKAYGNYKALIDDPEVQVVHNCTPNYLHLPVNMACFTLVLPHLTPIVRWGTFIIKPAYAYSVLIYLHPSRDPVAAAQ